MQDKITDFEAICAACGNGTSIKINEITLALLIALVFLLVAVRSKSITNKIPGLVAAVFIAAIIIYMSFDFNYCAPCGTDMVKLEINFFELFSRSWIVK